MIRRIVRIAMFAALMLGLAAVVACAPSKAEVAAQQRDECYGTMRQISMAMNLEHADSGVYPDIASVVKTLGAKCPSGGTYSFDPNTGTVSCSVHGVAPPVSNQ